MCTAPYAKIFHLELLNLKLTIFVKYHASTLCYAIELALELTIIVNCLIVLLLSGSSDGWKLQTSALTNTTDFYI